MNLVFLNSFKKDLAKITNTKLKEKIISIILSFQEAQSINDIPHLKKLKGYPFAYRIRIGDYRLGVYIEDDRIELVRSAKRSDIYKVFP